MNKYLITAAVGLLLTTANCVLAETIKDDKNVTISIGQASDNTASVPTTPTISVSPVQPTQLEQGGVPAATITLVPESNPVSPTVVPVVTEMPKADPAFFDHIVDAFNSKNIDALIENYSKDGFVVVNDKGEIITDKETLKQFYMKSLSGEKKATASINIGKLIDIAPGVAVASGKMTMKIEGEAHSMDSSMTATIKYEDGAWKIVSKQISLIEMPKTEEHKSGGGGLKAVLTLIVGVVIGYFASKYITKRPGASNA